MKISKFTLRFLLSSMAFALTKFATVCTSSIGALRVVPVPVARQASYRIDGLLVKTGMWAPLQGDLSFTQAEECMRRYTNQLLEERAEFSRTLTRTLASSVERVITKQ